MAWGCPEEDGSSVPCLTLCGFDTLVYCLHHVLVLPPPVKAGLGASAAFMILGLIATFVAMVLFFPLWHWFFYVIGTCVAIVSSTYVYSCLAIPLVTEG